MKKFILFSNGCPRCKVLKNKLIEKNIDFEISDNFDEIIQKNFQTVPVLKIDNDYFQFSDAIKVVNEL